MDGIPKFYRLYFTFVANIAMTFHVRPLLFRRVRVFREQVDVRSLDKSRWRPRIPSNACHAKASDVSLRYETDPFKKTLNDRTDHRQPYPVVMPRDEADHY